jgi:Rrf2 family transcriptional regulator, nitric oxide-sensitive transcriptional repressor
MKLTTFSDYTLRVLIYLALETDRLATIAQIASAYDISEHHLTKVVHRLAKAGWIESVRGRSGGIRLAHDPAQIRLGRVLRESESDAPFVECVSSQGNCRILSACRLAGILNGAVDEFYTSLDRHTLADLVDNRQRPLLGRVPIKVVAAS